MGYDVSLIVVSNSFTDGALKYTLNSNNLGSNGDVAPAISEQTDIQTGANDISFGSGYFTGPTDGSKVHSYTLKIYFPDTGITQNENQDKEFKGYVTLDKSNTESGCLTHNFTDNEMKPINLSEITMIKNTSIGFDEESQEPIFGDISLD